MLAGHLGGSYSLNPVGQPICRPRGGLKQRNMLNCEGDYKAYAGGKDPNSASYASVILVLD